MHCLRLRVMVMAGALRRKQDERSTGESGDAVSTEFNQGKGPLINCDGRKRSTFLYARRVLCGTIGWFHLIGKSTESDELSSPHRSPWPVPPASWHQGGTCRCEPTAMRGDCNAR